VTLFDFEVLFFLVFLTAFFAFVYPSAHVVILLEATKLTFAPLRPPLPTTPVSTDSSISTSASPSSSSSSSEPDDSESSSSSSSSLSSTVFLDFFLDRFVVVLLRLTGEVRSVTRFYMSALPHFKEVTADSNESSPT